MVSISRVGDNPAAGTTVQWLVTFNKPVAWPLALSAVTLAGSAASGAALGGVAPSTPSATYLVTASSTACTGTLGLNIDPRGASDAGGDHPPATTVVGEVFSVNRTTGECTPPPGPTPTPTPTVTPTPTATPTGTPTSTATPTPTPPDGGGTTPPGGIVPITPARLLDTRTSPGRIPGGHTRPLTVTGAHGIAGDAAGVLLNVTAVAPDGAGYVSAYPCGSDVPETSNVNFTEAGVVAPNSVFVKVGDGGQVCFYTSTGTDLVVDANGYVPAASSVFPVTPVRTLDTRQGTGRVAAGGTHTLQVTGRDGIPSGASAVFLNVTAVSPEAAGYVSVYPCGGDVPATSNVNFTAGGVVAPNSVYVKVGSGGSVCFYTLVATDLVVDVGGYVAADSTVGSVTPTRLLDTRQTSQRFLPAGGVLDLLVAGSGGIPGDATGVLLNVTAVGPDGAGYVSTYPCGDDLPATSNVNFTLAGGVAPNSAFVKVGPAGRVCFSASIGTDLVVDAFGYTT